MDVHRPIKKNHQKVCLGNQKKCVDIGIGGGAAPPQKNIALQAKKIGGGGDVRMQFVQGICTLYGQIKAKK